VSAVTVDVGLDAWRYRGRDGKEKRAVGKLVDGVLVLRPRMRDWREWVVWATGKSNVFITRFLNGIFNNAAVTLPTPLYFALWTAALTAASTAATAGETTYTGYARVSVTPNTTNFPASSAGSAIQNATAITFGADTVGTPVITYVAIVDSSSGAGNIVYWASITSTTINVGDTPQINTNAMTASEA
jgi:hypothetical protein